MREVEYLEIARTRFAHATVVAASMLAAWTTPGWAAPAEYQQAIAAAGPVLWYQFGETSGPAINHGSLGSAYNADYLGGATRTAPSQGGDRAVGFDSLDDYLESDALAPESLAGNPTFSAEALFYVVPDGFALLWAPLLHWGDSGGNPTMKSVYFSFQNNNALRMFAGFYNGGVRTGEIATRGRWHHLVWVRQGGGAANVGTTVYFDGEVVALENDPELPADAGTPNVVSTQFRINKARDFTRFFTGSIDELALYDKALTAEQVEAHYEAVLSGACPAERCIDYDGGCKVCGRPTGDAGKPNATDALIVLRKAVGTRNCNPCVCDVDASGSVVATDALLTLRRAVGQAIDLECPAGT